MATNEKPDTLHEASELEGLLMAYRYTKEREAAAMLEVKTWKAYADDLKEQISNQVPVEANVLTVNGRPVARLSRWTQQQFDQKKFREKEPDIYEMYVEDSFRSRLTTFKGLRRTDDNAGKVGPENSAAGQ